MSKKSGSSGKAALFQAGRSSSKKISRKYNYKSKYKKVAVLPIRIVVKRH